VDLPVLRSERVTLRPLTDDDVERLIAVTRSPSVRDWWDQDEDDDETREGLRSGSPFAIEVDGGLAGWLTFHEETEPSWKFAAIDIILDAGHQDRGIGSEALRTVIRWLVKERGHHRITIDPDVENARAIRAYEAVGFKPVGVMRQYERRTDGTYRDGLLMDLLAAELRSPASRSGR
jgi:aminoglycoside 6'-N-acetyltransferase